MLEVDRVLVAHVVWLALIWHVISIGSIEHHIGANFVLAKITVITWATIAVVVRRWRL